MNGKKRMRPAGSARFLAVLSIVSVVSVCVLPPPALPLEYAEIPGLLFHASFDIGGHEDIEPVIDRSLYPRPGREGWYPNADFARGSAVPNLSHGARPVKEGRFGEALHLAGGEGMLDFSALGNIITRRGTVAFWAKAEEPVGNWRGVIKLFAVPSAQWPARWPDRDFMRLRPRPERGWLELWSSDRAHYLRRLNVRWHPAREWWETAGEWRHYAVTWDAFTGRRLYIDGEFAAGMDYEPGSGEHTFPALRKIALGYRAGTRPAPQHSGFFYDELWIFDYPLEEEQIRALFRDNIPPSEPPAPPGRRGDSLWLREHLGIDSGGMPRWEGGVLEARKVPVKRALAKKINTRMPLDGKMHTVWPLEHKGFGEEELTLEFAESFRFNYVRIQGDIRGELLAGDSPAAVFSGDSFLQRKLLGRDVATGPRGGFRLSGSREDSGTISQIDLYRVGKAPEQPDDSPSGRVIYFQPGGELKTMGAVGKHLSGYFTEDNRAIIGGGPAPPGEHGTLAVTPCRLYHLVSEPLREDASIGRVELDLHLQGFSGETTPVSVRIWDTTAFMGLQGEFDFEIPALENERVRLSWEIDGFLLKPGQRVWMTFFFGEPGNIVFGPGASRVSLAESGLEQKNASIAAKEIIVSNLFSLLSEGRPWATRRGYPRKQHVFVDEILTRLEHILHFDPENRTAASMYSWILRYAETPGYWAPEYARNYSDPLAGIVPEPPDAVGPDWAVYGREALRILRQQPLWWARNRQTEEGLLGSGYWDDTCVINDWVNFALIDDPGGELREAFRKLADWTWENTLTDGLSRRARDMNHTYEEGTNIQPPLTLLFYGEPEYIERMMAVSRYYDGHITAVNAAGHRHVRSHYFSASAVREDPHHAYDTGMFRFAHPGRSLVWYNGSPAVLNVLRELQDSWLEHASAGPSFDYFGPAIDFSTDLPTKSRDSYTRRGPVEMWEHLYWLHRKTGEDKYRLPAVKNLRAGIIPRAFTPYLWTQWRKESPDEEADRGLLKALGEPDFENPGYWRQSGGYEHWQLSGDRSALIEGLKGDILYMKRYLPMHTRAEQSADRVSIPLRHLSAMFLGGCANSAKQQPYHFHAVSWEDTCEDTARFIVEDRPDRLKVLLYGFHEEGTVKAKMRVWKLKHGIYRVRAGIDKSGDEKIDSVLKDSEKELYRYEPVCIPVPPGEVVVAEIDLVEELEGITGRPDLAVGRKSAILREGGVLATIHNIGAEDAPASKALLTLNGDPVMEIRVPPIPAPTDLLPGTAEIFFPWRGTPGELEIVLDPDGEIDEITTVNNRAPVIGAR